MSYAVAAERIVPIKLELNVGHLVHAIHESVMKYSGNVVDYLEHQSRLGIHDPVTAIVLGMITKDGRLPKLFVSQYQKQNSI